MWFRKKVSLAKTHDERIQDAQDKVSSALDIFEQAKRNVEVANENLDQVIVEARADVERANSTINLAEARKLRNDALHAKFSDLTIAE
jgi:hypothetical protein